MMRILGALLLFFPLLIASCTSSETNSGDGSTATSDWELRLNETPLDFTLTLQEANPEGDGGVLIRSVGEIPGGEGEDPTPLEINIDLGGALVVSIPEATEEEPEPTAEVSVAAEDINVEVTIGTDRFLDTGGTITFSSYGTLVGERVKGDLDADLIGVLSSQSVSLAGSFNFKVKEETVEETTE